MPLTPKETRVLELFDQGKSWKQIAAILNISIFTAREYARRIIAKTFTVEMLARFSVNEAERNIRGAAHLRRHIPVFKCRRSKPLAKTRGNVCERSPL